MSPFLPAQQVSTKQLITKDSSHTDHMIARQEISTSYSQTCQLLQHILRKGRAFIMKFADENAAAGAYAAMRAESLSR